MLLFEFSSEHIHSTGYHYERAFVRLVIDKVCRRILACLTLSTRCISRHDRQISYVGYVWQTNAHSSLRTVVFQHVS